VAVLDEAGDFPVRDDVGFTGDHYGGLALGRQSLRKQYQVGANFSHIHAPGLDVLPAELGNFRSVALDHIHPDLVQEFQAFLIAEGGRAGSAGIQDHRDALTIGASRRKLHGFDQACRQSAYIKDQGGGDLGHFGGFLACVGHYWRRAKSFEHLGAVVNCHPVGQVMHDGVLPPDSIQQIESVGSHGHDPAGKPTLVGNLGLQITAIGFGFNGLQKGLEDLDARFSKAAR